MLNNASGFDHVYLAVGYTDLRRGIDGLVDIVLENHIEYSATRIPPIRNRIPVYRGLIPECF